MTNFLKMSSIGFLMLLYGCIFFKLIQQTELIIDFTSFYAALQKIAAHGNPYEALQNTFMSHPQTLTANLNPPFVLWLFTPLQNMPYQQALLIWNLLSIILGATGALIAFYYIFSFTFIRQHISNFILIYFAFFPILMNLTMGQIGAFLLFLLLIGYHFYSTGRSFLAGIVWGLLIALKFFPALLLFFVFFEKRYQVALVMSFTVLLCLLIPLALYGQTIYINYFIVMSKVSWYADNWNGSLYGLLARFVPKDYFHLLSMILPFLGFIWFLQRCCMLIKQGLNIHAFGFTIVMMLLLSPFGWLYYFPLLIFPLALLYANAYCTEYLLLSLLSFLLINMPQGYILLSNQSYSYINLLFFSCYFYGLFLLSWLLSAWKSRPLSVCNIANSASLNPAIFLILAFGVFVTAYRFMQQFY